MTYAADIAKKLRDVAVTIDITLATPSALTVRLTDRAGTYNSNVYEERIIAWGLAAQRADILTGDIAPLTGSFTVQNRKLNAQAAGETFGDLLSDYVFAGAVVTITQYAAVGGTPTSSTIFDGYIQGLDSYNQKQITFNISEDFTWNTTIPPIVINKHDHPNAPEENWGKRMPLIFGEFRASTLGITVECGERHPCTPIICYDKIGTLSYPRWAICDNSSTGASEASATPGIWEDSLSEMAFIDAATYGGDNNLGGPHWIQFNQVPTATVYLIPKGVGDDTDCTNPEFAFDRNSTTYAEIDDSEILSLPLGNYSNVGIVLSVDVKIVWNTSGAAGTLTYGLYDPVNTQYYAGESDTVALAGSGSDSFTVSSLEAPWRDWRWIQADGSDDEYPVELRASVENGGTGNVDIYYFVIAVNYQIETNLLGQPAGWKVPLNWRWPGNRWGGF